MATYVYFRGKDFGCLQRDAIDRVSGGPVEGYFRDRNDGSHPAAWRKMVAGLSRGDEVYAASMNFVGADVGEVVDAIEQVVDRGACIIFADSPCHFSEDDSEGRGALEGMRAMAAFALSCAPDDEGDR